MRTRRTTARFGPAFFGVILLGAPLSFLSGVRAQTPAPQVAIGDLAVSENELKRALSECKKHAPELRANVCLDRFWVARWLLDKKATDDNLAAAPALRNVQQELLATRLLEIVREKAKKPSKEEVDAYLKKHERDYAKPLRIRIFRILVTEEAKAQELLGKLGPTTTLADFRSLAREHSIDRATNERGGDLGFVWPDGSTDVPQVSAETSLYEAALPLEDGAFAPAPVPEGKQFAVLWRRGSLPAQPLDDDVRDIAQRNLAEEQAEKDTVALLRKLAPSAKNRDDELLGKLRRPEATLFQEPRKKPQPGG